MVKGEAISQIESGRLSASIRGSLEVAICDWHSFRYSWRRLDSLGDPSIETEARRLVVDLASLDIEVKCES